MRHRPSKNSRTNKQHLHSMRTVFLLFLNFFFCFVLFCFRVTASPEWLYLLCHFEEEPQIRPSFSSLRVCLRCNPCTVFASASVAVYGRRRGRRHYLVPQRPRCTL